MKLLFVYCYYIIIILFIIIISLLYYFIIIYYYLLKDPNNNNGTNFDNLRSLLLLIFVSVHTGIIIWNKYNIESICNGNYHNYITITSFPSMFLTFTIILIIYDDC